MKKIAAAAVIAALAALSGEAIAANATIYGRIDAGLKYTHVKHGSDTLELASGGRSHNRFGFNITEDLGNGWKAKGYLENGFTLDDGAYDTASQIFNRRSILAIASPYGEIGAGRAGTVQSTMAPYTMGLIKYDPFGTSYGYASIGSTFANTSRVNNGIHYISPKFSGVNFGLSYSFGDAKDENGWSDNDHTFAFATNYTAQDLYLSATFANVTYGENKREDARLYGAGGWWRFLPEWRLFAAAAYQDGWKSAAGLTVTADKNGVTSVQAKNGFDGYSSMLGLDWTRGQHKVMAGVQYFKGELKKDSSADYRRTVYAAAYEYYFSKTFIGYAALAHSMTSGHAKAIAADKSSDATQIFLGINKNF